MEAVSSALPAVAFPATPDAPIVLGGRPWDEGVVLDASRAATALGVRRGMALAAAHRLAPDATFLPASPEADAAAVESALERLGAFSPGVAGVTDPRDPAFGLLELQADGLGRLWGDDEALVARICASLAPILPGRPAAGIAGTRFAATLAAAAGVEPLLVVPGGGEAAFLAPLPAALLSTDGAVRERLTQYGLRTIGSVAGIARSALVARFGPEGERLHARANGVETDLFRPRRSRERLALALPVEPPVEEIEPLRFILRRLAATLADQLTARGAAAAIGLLRLELEPPGSSSGTAGPVELVVEHRFPEPTADAAAIERLLLARLERTPPASSVARLELELDGVEAAAGRQLALFAPQANGAGRLAWQLAGLALRFGEDRVGRLEILDPEALLPAQRSRWEAAAVDGSGRTGAAR